MSAMAEAAPAAPPKLPFWRTLGQSYAVWFKDLPELIRIAWLWILVMVPIVGLFMWWQTPIMLELIQNARLNRPDPNPGMTVLMQAINSIILLPVLSSIAVAWHRLLLRNERVSGPYLRLDSVVIGYAVLFFLIALLFSVPQYLGQIYLALTQPPGAIEVSPAAIGVQLVGSMLTLIALFFGCRLFMVLPAKALERDISFGTAWAATRKNSWRLFWGYMLSLLPFAAIAGVIGFWIAAARPSLAVAATIWTIITLLWTLFGMVGVGFLSLSYRHFFERPD
jgi:hypothetical protein